MAEEAEETDTPSDELEVELGVDVEVGEDDDVEVGWDRARPLISSSYCLQDKISSHFPSFVWV